jgi:lysophospholipase L1-like esterase
LRVGSLITRFAPGALIASLLAAGCGDNPMGPSQPPTEGPKLACPANQSTRTTSRSATVTYPLPSVSGGTAPVSVSCSPPSGSSFPAGSSTTTCVATDAMQRTDRCTFTVTVDVVPLLGATRFVAFGDSITEGKMANGDTAQPNYPDGLRQQLAARYTSQIVTVITEGAGGETSAGGVIRLPGVLAADNPEVVLLFEGVNDLAPGNPSLISPLISNLRTMIQQARGRNVQVLLATLLPEIAGGSRAGAAALIVPANDQIRALAASQGATLVDLYAAFSGQERTLIGSDGLHPTQAGHDTIARTFYDVIRVRFEVPPTSTLTQHRPAAGQPFGWRGE